LPVTPSPLRTTTLRTIPAAWSNTNTWPGDSSSPGAQTKGFLVPLTAIAPGDDESPGHVFVFDQAAGIVRKVVVRSGEGVTGNLVAVRGELDAGDIIAAAGVSFLREGQRVKLLGE
ncbi:MAG: hypothetical protein AAGD47_03530, partial [Pseudomonadota bacterium]